MHGLNAGVDRAGKRADLMDFPVREMVEDSCRWIVIDARDQVMRCDRCRETKSLDQISGREGMEAVKIIRNFTETHKDCKGPRCADTVDMFRDLK